MELELLIMRIRGTDLEQFLDNTELLEYALNYAKSEILKRRGANELEGQYSINQIEGAVWFLSTIGAEGAKSVSENGVSINYKDVPDWLISVVPRLG